MSGFTVWSDFLSAFDGDVDVLPTLPPNGSVFLGTNRKDDVTLNAPTVFVSLLNKADTLTLNAESTFVDTGWGRDTVTVNARVEYLGTGHGRDTVETNAYVAHIDTGRAKDVVQLNAEAGVVDLGHGADTLTALEYVDEVNAGAGRDQVTLRGGGGDIYMGDQRDELTLSELVDLADGGNGRDTLNLDFEAGDVDVSIETDHIVLSDSFSGQTMIVQNFETINFSDRSYTVGDMEDQFGGPDPYIQVGGGTQVVTINEPEPTVSVLWDRVVQQAVINTDMPVGPTIVSRAYAMLHTAMYDAWSAYDDTAIRSTLDLEGDNLEVIGTEADKIKAMSFAAITVLRDLFPDQEDLYKEVMSERLGFAMTDDGSVEAEIGIDAAEDLIALRLADEANQAGGYADTTGYTPVNPGPELINDITRWTPENVPIDPETAPAEQTFLTPQWMNVESFAIAEDASGNNDFSAIRPPAPQPFFTDDFADATLDMATKTITLGTDGTIDGTAVFAGDVIAVDKSLIGEVINAGFIDQAQEVVDYSANLTDEHKIIAEFWEDGAGTAFPPGTFMAFAQYVSARDNNSVDTDAALFFAMGNAMLDASIASWEAKVFYDYARPVRAIRDLGELGLIGEWGVDEVTGETGYVISAYGGYNDNGSGRGTKTILAENFVTFQRDGGEPSPPFAEYTSGHSAFSLAGATVLRLFTGSDDFGGSVTFAPGSTQFESGVPLEETILYWDTFTDAGNQSGISRLYGGIHFTEGDLNGRALGAAVGEDAFDLAMRFVDGTALPEDNPFFDMV